VIIIVGDALRPDRMQINGYERPTTPHLVSRARVMDVQRVDRMTAVCAESSCGLMGLLNSKYTHQLAPRSFSLFEVLRQYGYRVQLIFGGDHSNFYGLKEAFGEVDDFHDGSMAEGRYMNDDRLVLDRVET